MNARGDGKLRIIAGAFRGRMIRTLDAPGTRPMTDRVRENLFNILAPRLPGAAFLDLFAGSGAVGIEALSRGASAATFVEYAGNWAGMIAENLAGFALNDRARILRADAYAAVRTLDGEGRKFDIVFVGAPYDEDHHNRMLSALLQTPLCNPGGVIVLQYRHGDPLHAAAAEDLYTLRLRDYGITSLAFLEGRDA